MENFDFEKLEVYRQTIVFVGKIYDVFDCLPYQTQKTVGDNLLRASVSIASNIAEGSGRRGRKEKRHLFEIAQGSAFECIPSLTLLYQKGKLNKEKFEELYNGCYAISKMLSGLIKRFSY